MTLQQQMDMKGLEANRKIFTERLRQAIWWIQSLLDIEEARHKLQIEIEKGE